MFCMPFLEHVFVCYLSRGWMNPEHVRIYDRRDGQCSLCFHGRRLMSTELTSSSIFQTPSTESVLFYFIFN